MTGNPVAAGSGVQTLSVNQSVGSCRTGGGAAVAGRPRVACGGGGPNRSASRTPSQPSAGRGAWKRSAPTGGAANGMPRKTATSCSTRPRTEPAPVRTTGDVGSAMALPYACADHVTDVDASRHDSGARPQARQKLQQAGPRVEPAERIGLLGAADRQAAVPRADGLGTAGRHV